MASRKAIRAILARPYHRVVSRGEEGMYTSMVVELPGVISEGETAEEAFENLEEAFGLVVDVMLDDGDPIPEPMELDRYSGRLQLRLPPSLHRRAAIRAHFEGVSLNRMLSDAVAMYVGMPAATSALGTTEVAPASKPRAARRKPAAPTAAARPARATKTAKAVSK